MLGCHNQIEVEQTDYSSHLDDEKSFLYEFDKNEFLEY